MTAQLRDYQQRAIDELYDWLGNNVGNPCLVLPTGAGKSHVVAALCRDVLQEWPETRVLMLTHVKELIEQNAAKMLEHWPDAPLGIYSASVGSKKIDSITFAGIQSAHKRVGLIGHVDLVIIDECHLVSHKQEGTYCAMINGLKKINPKLCVVGLTATPYRLGHGLITEGDALFDALIEPVSIEELVSRKFLAPLRSKVTESRLDVTGVAKRGGEFIEAELQRAVNRPDKTAAVVDEVIRLAGDRKAWLFFCAGVEHAESVRDALIDRGVLAKSIFGHTPTAEREQIIADFRSGKIKALTNANVLTTGFDYPDIDLIAMLRPTMSPTLYVQMAGRGMRPKGHTDHCLVLDFAGVVSTHGPVTSVNPPKKAGEGNGEAPVKSCPECHELVAIAARECSSCGYEFPAPQAKKLELHNDDIMGASGNELIVSHWWWRKHVSRASGIEMLAVSYYTDDMSAQPVLEYLPVLHDGQPGQRALQLLAVMARHSGALSALDQHDLTDVARELNGGKPPQKIRYRKDGKFYRVTRRDWSAADRARGAAAAGAVVSAQVA